MAFVPNNIRYRSVTSRALEQFYNAKGYILNELVNEQNQFSEVAKELLLLHFNSYTTWATDMEYSLLNCTVVDAAYIESLVAQVDRVTDYHQQLYEIHVDLFDPSFISLWQNISLEAFKFKIRQAEGLHQLVAYPTLVCSLNQYLQTCMYELYELDCLLGSGTTMGTSTNKSNRHQLLIYVDDFAVEYAQKTGRFMCAERLEHYRKLLHQPIPVMIKNYSSKNLSFCGRFEGDPDLVKLFQPLCANTSFIGAFTEPPPEDVHHYYKR